MTVKETIEAVLELIKPFGGMMAITAILGVCTIVAKAIVRIDIRPARNDFEEFYPEEGEQAPTQSSCPYCGQKYETETHYCSNCKTPF
jgi:hypothetical protein